MSTYPDILTKENFWNDLQAKYPEQMKVFCDWIDEYKKKVDWTTLFRERLHFPDGYDELAPKFHEIPVAMQIGIFFQFTTEVNGKKNSLFYAEAPHEMDEFISYIREWFYMD